MSILSDVEVISDRLSLTVKVRMYFTNAYKSVLPSFYFENLMVEGDWSNDNALVIIDKSWSKVSTFIKGKEKFPDGFRVEQYYSSTSNPYGLGSMVHTHYVTVKDILNYEPTE